MFARYVVNRVVMEVKRDQEHLRKLAGKTVDFKNDLKVFLCGILRLFCSLISTTVFICQLLASFLFLSLGFSTYHVSCSIIIDKSDTCPADPIVFRGIAIGPAERHIFYSFFKSNLELVRLLVEYPNYLGLLERTCQSTGHFNIFESSQIKS